MIPVDVLVEQAIARGESTERITRTLGVSPSFVAAVWARLELLNCETDTEGTGKFVRPPRQLQPCGTLAAYRRHARRKEKPCRACKDAHNADYLDRKRRGAA